MNHLKGRPLGEHKVLEPLPVVKNISNKEMGRPLERMPKPNETSFIAFAHLKIKIVCACCSATNTFYL